MQLNLRQFRMRFCLTLTKLCFNKEVINMQFLPILFVHYPAKKVMRVKVNIVSAASDGLLRNSYRTIFIFRYHAFSVQHACFLSRHAYLAENFDVVEPCSHTVQRNSLTRPVLRNEQPRSRHMLISPQVVARGICDVEFTLFEQKVQQSTIR